MAILVLKKDRDVIVQIWIDILYLEILLSLKTSLSLPLCLVQVRGRRIFLFIHSHLQLPTLIWLLQCLFLIIHLYLKSTLVYNLQVNVLSKKTLCYRQVMSFPLPFVKLNVLPLIRLLLVYLMTNHYLLHVRLLNLSTLSRYLRLFIRGIR